MFFCDFTKWIFSKSVLKVEQFYLGHFCTKICCQNVSKAAQSGHTECARVSPRFFPAPIPSVESTTLSLILKRQTQTAAKGPSFLSIYLPIHDQYACPLVFLAGPLLVHKSVKLNPLSCTFSSGLSIYLFFIIIDRAASLFISLHLFI